MSGGWQPKSALVVDDDIAIRDYVSQLLTRAGLKVDLAQDGREAEEKLRASQFDLLFLDLDMPVFSGMFILELLRRGRAGRPSWTIVMSAAPNLSDKLGDDWARLGIADVLPKPFGAHDVQRALDRVKATVGANRSVLVVGSGDWTAAVANSVKKAGGACVVVADPKAVPPLLDSSPGVLVAGPPLKIPDVIALSLTIPADKRARMHVLVATPEIDVAIRTDLLTIGARAIALPAGLPWLCGDVVRLAGLTPPESRAPFARAVLLRAQNAVLHGTGVEISELGISAIFPPSDPPVPPFTLEFELEGRMVESTVAIASVDPMVDGRLQAAFHFTGMAEHDLQRVRRLVFASGS